VKVAHWICFRYFILKFVSMGVLRFFRRLNCFGSSQRKVKSRWESLYLLLRLVFHLLVLLLLFLRLIIDTLLFRRRKMKNELCNLHETIRIIEEDNEITRWELRFNFVHCTDERSLPRPFNLSSKNIVLCCAPSFLAYNEISTFQQPRLSSHTRNMKVFRKKSSLNANNE